MLQLQISMRSSPFLVVPVMFHMNKVIVAAVNVHRNCQKNLAIACAHFSGLNYKIAWH